MQLYKWVIRGKLQLTAYSSDFSSFFTQGVCYLCPGGSYCPDPAQVPQACDLGYYSLGGASDSCIECPAGASCSDRGANYTGPIMCNEGYYAAAVSKSPAKTTQISCNFPTFVTSPYFLIPNELVIPMYG